MYVLWKIQREDREGKQYGGNEDWGMGWELEQQNLD